MMPKGMDAQIHPAVLVQSALALAALVFAATGPPPPRAAAWCYRILGVSLLIFAAWYQLRALVPVVFG